MPCAGVKKIMDGYYQKMDGFEKITDGFVTILFLLLRLKGDFASLRPLADPRS